MDLPPSGQEPEAGPFPPGPAAAAARAAGAPTDITRAGELEWRLSQLEAGLRHIDRRLDRLEESIARTVAEHTQTVGRDLRHTVSELGRRLVLELPQVLARHRDEIVAELRPPVVEPEPEPEPEVEPEVALPDVVDGEATPPAAETVTTGGEDTLVASKRRRRVHVLRQRDG